MYPQATLKLARSASDQNTVLTYVCLVNDINPNGHSSAARTHHNIPTHLDLDTTQEVEDNDDHLKVERSKALHELVESHKDSNEAVDVNRTYENYLLSPLASGEEESDSQNDTDPLGNPNILSLTKMKWLTENQNEAPDSSSPSISTSSSLSSLSKDSQIKLDDHNNLSDKYLSTILRLDKEHNLFGLSNIAIVGSLTSKKTRKEDDKPVFHQTAIVQTCCKGGTCCYNKSHSQLPSSLKCGGCTCCCTSYASDCASYVTYLPSCCADPCPDFISCKRFKHSPCALSRSLVECQPCSVKIAINTKPKFEPAVVEVTPRSSCVLQKPFAARSCHHLPRCIPPSSCFPYLMPCFWPARASAPCTNPDRCFHNPPCMAARKPRSARASDACPLVGTCSKTGDDKIKCKSHTCPGKIDSKNEPTAPGCHDDDVAGNESKKNRTECDCLTQCANYFVVWLKWLKPGLHLVAPTISDKPTFVNPKFK